MAVVLTLCVAALPLGTQAPAFSLPDPSGEVVSLDDFKEAKALVVTFICNHCPFVKHVQKELVKIHKDYAPKGVGLVAINANDWSTYPGDSPENMAKEIKKVGYKFPYLVDESQEVALAYQARCTPDTFVFDGKRTLVYHGQIDDSRPGKDIPVTGQDLRAALDAVLAGETPSKEQEPSVGCSIKWKPGNTPED